MKRQNLYPNKLSRASTLDSFGMLMKERTYSSTTYRFGFNGQEKDDEVDGEGNINTAQYWEYDCRLGRRWNLDPKQQISISDYTCFRNNPILLIDKDGDSPMPNLIKSLVMRHKMSKFHRFEKKEIKRMVASGISNPTMDQVHTQMKNDYRTRRFMYVRPKYYTSGIEGSGVKDWYSMISITDFTRGVTTPVPGATITLPAIPISTGLLAIDPRSGIPEWTIQIPNPAIPGGGAAPLPPGTTVTAAITNTYTPAVPASSAIPLNLNIDQDPVAFGNTTNIAINTPMVSPAFTIITPPLTPNNFLTVGLIQNGTPGFAANTTVQFSFNLQATNAPRFPKLIGWSNTGSMNTFRNARKDLGKNL